MCLASNSFPMENRQLWPHAGGEQRCRQSRDWPGSHTELNLAKPSPFDGNSEGHKKREHFTCQCVFLVHFHPSHVSHDDALCGNVSLSQLCSRERGTEKLSQMWPSVQGEQHPRGAGSWGSRTGAGLCREHSSCGIRGGGKPGKTRS